MNLAHVHLLLNHIPVLGSVFSLLMMVYAYIRKNHELMKTALVILILVALMTIPTFLTGDPAEEIVENITGVDKSLIHEHDESAGFALTGILILGVVNLAGLIYYRKKSSFPQGYIIPVILLTILICTVMARTAHLGGLIHHPETRSDFIVPEIHEDHDEDKE